MPGNWGSYLGQVTLKLEKEGDSWKIIDSKVETLQVKGVQPDEEVLLLTKEYEDKVQTWLDQPVGYAKGDFWIENPLFARLKDNALIEFVNKVQMYYSGAKISSTALFNNDIKGWKEGPVSLRDIYGVYIYANTLKVIKVTGKDIKDTLELSADYFVYENNKVDVNKTWIEPKPKHCNYDMWEGITYKIVLNRPSGNRIVDLEFEGKPIDMDTEYEIVLNNYRAGGGGRYNMLKGKPVVKEVMREVAVLMVDYVLENKVIESTVDNNWEAVVQYEYTVKEGDTLENIAKSLGIPADELIKWNNIKDVNLTPGMKLIYYVSYLDTLTSLKNASGF